MPMMSALRRTVVAPAAALLLAAYLPACFHYVPANVTSLPGPQSEVRVTLNRPIDIPMGEFTLNEVERIEGIVSAAERDTLVVVARWLHPRVGTKWDAMLGSYGIPIGEIQQLEEWRLSPRTTAIVLGASAAVLAVLFSAVRRATSGGGVQPPPPDATSVVGSR